MPVPNPDLTYQEAWRTDSGVETVWHPEGNDYLISLAPHGGDIEMGTDTAAVELYKEIPDQRCSCWMFHGFGREAFDEYHVTSSKIDSDRFPKLGVIEDVGFSYAVSFHVKRNAEQIEVGGGIDREFRGMVADVLEDAVNGTWVAEHRRSEIKFKGDTEANVTNWLTADSASGIQIELPIVASRNWRKRIARGLAEFFEEL